MQNQSPHALHNRCVFWKESRLWQSDKTRWERTQINNKQPNRGLFFLFVKVTTSAATPKAKRIHSQRSLNLGFNPAHEYHRIIISSVELNIKKTYFYAHWTVARAIMHLTHTFCFVLTTLCPELLFFFFGSSQQRHKTRMNISLGSSACVCFRISVFDIWPAAVLIPFPSPLIRRHSQPIRNSAQLSWDHWNHRRGFFTKFGHAAQRILSTFSLMERQIQRE